MNSRASAIEAQTIEITILLLNDFSMLSLVSILETARIANRIAEREVMNCRCISETGRAVHSSLGIELPVEHGLAMPRAGSILLVCGGTNVVAQASSQTDSWLRRCASHGVRMGGLCTGGYVLARAGIIRDRELAIHWEHHEGLREELPDIRISKAPYAIDGPILSSAGGTAGIDLALDLIVQSGATTLSREVAKQLNYVDIHDLQNYLDATAAGQVTVRNPRLLAVVQEMERSVEDPRPIAHFARLAGVSVRQLERLFLSHLDDTPFHYYVKIRLDRALRLLIQTDMKILDVALATGFGSRNAFARNFRRRYGRSPSDLRR